MPKNTGKPTEKDFEAILNSFGKFACYHRLVDASEIKGRTGQVAVSARTAPADYIVTFNQETFLAEVKSTWNDHSFPFSLIKPSQWSAGVRTITAGGLYKVYVKNLNTNEWFVIPFQKILAIKQQNKSSIKWNDLKEQGYLWLSSTTT